jgi:uncharacterized protein (TIGR00251 family)
MQLNDYIKREWNIWLLELRINPNAKQTIIHWLMANNVLKIRLKAVPEKWKANKELIDFISNSLKIKKSNISIVSGSINQNKIVKIDF